MENLKSNMKKRAKKNLRMIRKIEQKKEDQERNREVEEEKQYSRELDSSEEEIDIQNWVELVLRFQKEICCKKKMKKIQRRKEEIKDQRGEERKDKM